MLNFYISFFLFSFHLILFIMFMYFMSGGFILSMSFIFFPSYSFDFMFIFDWISCGFSSFVMLISSVVFIYSGFYMEGDLSIRRYLWVLFLFVCSMLLLVFSPNMFSLMVGWDGLGLVSFLLVVYYNNFSSLRSGLLTVLTNRIGDLSMMVSFFFFYAYGSWGLLSFYNDSIIFLGAFVMLAASTKSAQLPFSSWLPAAMAAPTPVSSLVHSSTLVTAGVYLLIRFYYSLSFMLNSLIFCFISLMTMFFSGFLAFFEMDMSKVVAMSTLSQLGMMMFVISLGEWSFGFFHMICHALFKALLFLSCGGFIFYSSGGQDIRQSGGFVSISPFFCIIFIFSSMSLCGFPFLSGFFSKDLILESSFGLGWGLFCIMIFFLSCIFSLVYSLRLFYFGLLYYNFLGCSLLIYSEMSSIYMMYIMGSWSMISGYFLSSMLFLDSFFLVSLNLKSIGLVILIFGIVFYFLGINLNFFISFKSFFSDMFYISWFSGWPMSKFGSFFGFINSSELLWIEILGPKSFVSFSSFSSLFFNNVDYFLYKMIYVFIGMFFVVFFFMLYICN
uniref:NADH:ubiquinone reductase (H(+)-translocating) n=1 Tax=Sperchon plumifer TaxID=2047715 RepID=A0A3G1VW74_9ACAR|nr:NADH dehydrogenase subunit 5 [Sperchon plumifer]AYK28784.1 NADH dehydrogenase subunit 5 [Sperchon plumifer]